jgi:ADP-ribose pyrophosphatase YjhB (NUDIX family)
MEASAVTRTVVRAVVTGDGDRVLLVRRSPGDRLGLHWELPGGRLGEDETVAEAFARELEEETGLSLAGPPVLVGSAERVTPSGRLITEYAFAVPSRGELRLSPEHDAACWVRAGEEAPGPVTEAAREILAQG